MSIASGTKSLSHKEITAVDVLKTDENAVFLMNNKDVGTKKVEVQPMTD